MTTQASTVGTDTGTAAWEDSQTDDDFIRILVQHSTQYPAQFSKPDYKSYDKFTKSTNKRIISESGNNTNGSPELPAFSLLVVVESVESSKESELTLETDYKGSYYDLLILAIPEYKR